MNFPVGVMGASRQFGDDAQKKAPKRAAN